MRAPLVNVDRLAHRLGRTPTRGDIVVEFLRRPVFAVVQALRSAVRRVGPRRVVR
jgi:hypothetical protein